ncbi:hypothetical protein M413DRAFT_447609 [Hebeloma cylindrosporum]|uniref:Uncharacterized protein n=1 Tax=Hebeloma cylindrosporum TaxID=76867 RepID=A0A0C3C4W6_HEBCY|nr:hypothetical protein M413DRAFT_447609 [Hebeloma cylindrosporum h7]
MNVQDLTGSSSRDVDNDSRKMRVTTYRRASRDGTQSTYLFFYTLRISPTLPINLTMANLLGGASQVKRRKRLFWRGDIVAMKVNPVLERIENVIESVDADLREVGFLEGWLMARYREGAFQRMLYNLELEWDFYLSSFCGPSSLVFGPSKSYWGENAAKKEENFLNDLNELRSAIGRPPRPPHPYMKSYAQHGITLYSALKSTVKSAFVQVGIHSDPNRKITGPPKLPPELEREIFEICAFDCTEMCTVLVLVAKRVNTWIDPILLSTVCFSITEDQAVLLGCSTATRRRDRLGEFLVKLTNGKPVEYFARHVKNLAILASSASSPSSGPSRLLDRSCSGSCADSFSCSTSCASDSDTQQQQRRTTTINRILGICTGVERLAVTVTPASCGGFDLLRSAGVGRNLRRLSVRLSSFSPLLLDGGWEGGEAQRGREGDGNGDEEQTESTATSNPNPTPTFHHPLFSTLTHLHLWDEEYTWPTYEGWETLTSLTHLAFARASLGDVERLLTRRSASAVFPSPSESASPISPSPSPSESASPLSPPPSPTTPPILPNLRYIAVGYYVDTERHRFGEAAVNTNISTTWGSVGDGTVKVVLFPEIPQRDWEGGARGEGDFWEVVEREIDGGSGSRWVKGGVGDGDSSLSSKDVEEDDR